MVVYAIGQEYTQNQNDKSWGLKSIQSCFSNIWYSLSQKEPSCWYNLWAERVDILYNMYGQIECEDEFLLTF
jgi:hypothetical protein